MDERVMTSTILFCRTSEGAKAPTRGYSGDAGWDLYTSRATVVPARSSATVPTDIRVSLPRNHWAAITPRSSTMKRLGLHVVEAVIDNGFRGELFVQVYNTKDEDVLINMGERVAQLIPHLILPIEWRELSHLPGSDRGGNGFGSTGR